MSKEKLSEKEFETLLKNFVDLRLKEGKTQEETKKEFMSQYLRLTVRQFEILMFHDFLIIYSPELLEESLSGGDEARSKLELMVAAWLYRADFHRISFSGKEKGATLH